MINDDLERYREIVSTAVDELLDVWERALADGERLHQVPLPGRPYDIPGGHEWDALHGADWRLRHDAWVRCLDILRVMERINTALDVLNPEDHKRLLDAQDAWRRASWR